MSWMFSRTVFGWFFAVMVGAALGVFAHVSGTAIFARYLQFPVIPGAGELAVICGAIAGAGLGFPPSKSLKPGDLVRSELPGIGAPENPVA